MTGPKKYVKRLRATPLPEPETDAQLNVQIPAGLLRRLEYAGGLPAHQGHGGTFEALVVRALEDGLIGIAISYERFEETKPITDDLHADIEMARPKPKTRIAAGSKGKRLIHRR